MTRQLLILAAAVANEAELVAEELRQPGDDRWQGRQALDVPGDGGAVDHAMTLARRAGTDNPLPFPLGPAQSAAR